MKREVEEEEEQEFKEVKGKEKNVPYGIEQKKKKVRPKEQEKAQEEGGEEGFEEVPSKTKKRRPENVEGEEGEGDGYGVVTLTIEGGAITACDFKTYEPDGTLKDEDYGKQNGEIANQDYYNKAQKALAGANEYAKILVEVGDYHAIDSISGATISYDQFMEAVDDALYQAKE